MIAIGTGATVHGEYFNYFTYYDSISLIFVPLAVIFDIDLILELLSFNCIL